MTPFEIPRCRHGRIILGCPDDACPEQNTYLAEQEAAYERWWANQVQNARDVVRQLLLGELEENPQP